MSKIINFIISALSHSIAIILLGIAAVFVVNFPALSVVALIIGVIFAAQDIKKVGDLND